MQFTWEEIWWISSFVACVSHIYILQFSTWNDLIGNVTPHTYFQKTGNFSKTFDDWNTATQCLNLFTSIWRSYFKVCFNFLLYLMLISNIYQNSYKGDKRHFHFQYWPLKQRNLNMTFSLLLWVSFPQFHCVEIGFI